MDFELTRFDYCTVGTIGPNCIQLLPQSPKEAQRVAVGDQDCVIQLFSIKKGEVQTHFKTLPGDSIANVQLGGGQRQVADKIFVANENKVRGYNKKGKQFLSFDTNMTETIKSMIVLGDDLFVSGNHVFNHFRDCKDMGSYLCGDTIVDINVMCPNNTNRIIVVLACSGRVLRLLEHSRVRQTIEVSSVPTTLHVPKGLGDKLFCGFSDGRVILYKIAHFTVDVKEQIIVNGNQSAITCIESFDLTDDGNEELIIGRRDGSVEIYILPSLENGIETETRLIYKNNFEESISSVKGGCVGESGYLEIIVCTYSGLIFGLTTQCISSSISNDSKDNEMRAKMMDSIAIGKLKKEIEDMKLKVEKERNRYQNSTSGISSGVSAIPMLPVNESLELNKETGIYCLTMELPCAIDFVLFQSTTSIELIDTEKNQAVVSVCDCDPLSGNSFLAVFRCQGNSNSVIANFRTLEGQHGILKAYVTPNLQPKVSQLKQFIIRPLSLHIRLHSINRERPVSTLSLKGAFSHAEMHNWLCYCLPEVPEKLYSSEKNVLYFENIFCGTQLECEYMKGQAEFKSDNITTISILKDYLTKEATKKRIKLEINMNMNDLCVEWLIRSLEAKMKSSGKSQKDLEILIALEDLGLQNDEERDSLCDEYKDILSRKNDIKKDKENKTINQSYLNGLITDLYIDRNRFKGINVKSQLPKLVELIKNFNSEELINYCLGRNSMESNQEL